MESQWKGKKWTVIGDSNTEANQFGTNADKYHGLLAAKKGMRAVQNLGYSGTGWFNSFQNEDNAYYLRLHEVDEDADLITILGGGNDYKENEKPLVLGQLGDRHPEKTFYGAILYCLETLIVTRPNAKLAVFSQFRRDVGMPTNEKLEAMVRAQAEVCAYIGVPFLNLFHQANQYPWLQWWREKYMTDGIHLNEAGHKLLAQKMNIFLETI